MENSSRPKTIEELVEFIKAQEEKSDTAGAGAEGYEASANAALEITMAAFEYAASSQGLTGFQAGWASLQFLARVQNLKCPFAIVEAEKMLYPQYPLPSERARQLEESYHWRAWARAEARRLLAETPEAAPRVVEHWKRLAEEIIEPEEGQEDV